MAGTTKDFNSVILSQEPAIEVLGGGSFKMITSAGILSLTTVFSKNSMNYECTLEPGEDKLTKRAKSKYPIWESHKVWDDLAEEWGLNPDSWQSFRLGCKKLTIEHQEKAAEEREAAEETDSELMKKVREKALDIMQHGDPIDFMVKTIGKRHLGDKAMARLIMCCKGAQRVKNSRGIHPKLNGESGTGKSDLVEHCLHVMDESCYIKGSASPKALFYHTIPDGLILFMDDYKPDEDLDTIIKQTSSNFHEPYTHLTVIDKQASELHTPAEIVWCITSVDSSQDIQVLNRQFACDVDDSEELTKEVIKKTFTDSVTAALRFPVDEDVLVCREMSKMLQSQKFTVAVPFANDIEWNDVSSRRNPTIFLDIILAHTAWRYMQRDRDENGNLVATVQDFNDAKELYTSRAGAMMDKLTDRQRELLEIVAKAPGSQIFMDDAAKIMGITSQRGSDLAKGTRDKKSGKLCGGIIQKIPGFTVEQVVVPFEGGATKKNLMKLTVDEKKGWGSTSFAVTLKNEKQWALQGDSNGTSRGTSIDDISSSRGTPSTSIVKEGE